MLKKFITRILFGRDGFERKVSELITKHIEENYIVCEVTKALIPREKAVEGKGEVRENPDYSSKLSSYFWYGGEKPQKEFIYKPYFSPHFVPKK